MIIIFVNIEAKNDEDFRAIKNFLKFIKFIDLSPINYRLYQGLTKQKWKTECRNIGIVIG